MKKLILLLSFLLLLCGCGEEEFALPYGSLENNNSYSMESEAAEGQLPFFAEELAASATDLTESSSLDPGWIKAGGVYDLTDKAAVYSYHATERVYPASLTKIMTALLVLENCPDLNQVITVGDVSIKVDGAQLFGFKQGDRISVKDLLYSTLIYSANDGALALALYVGGSEEGFVEMMNARAAELGCSKTHFMNPHGLSNDEHYTSAYDLYLIFNAAVRFDVFREIISTVKYTLNYENSEMESVSKEIVSLNGYLTGANKAPSGLEIVGGKTGTTQQAGRCLILYVKGPSGKDYISVIMGANDNDTLYSAMNRLCEDCCE